MMLQVRISHYERAAFEAQAKRLGMNLSSWVRMTLRERTGEFLPAPGTGAAAAMTAQEASRAHVERAAADLLKQKGSPATTEAAGKSDIWSPEPTLLQNVPRETMAPSPPETVASSVQPKPRVEIIAMGPSLVATGPAIDENLAALQTGVDPSPQGLPGSPPVPYCASCGLYEVLAAGDVCVNCRPPAPRPDDPVEE